MKTPVLLAAAYFSVALMAAAQDTSRSSATGGSATGGSATAGTVQGGSATGGSAVGGSATATGGSATGGSAVGGSATTSATGGRATHGKSTPGTATAQVGGRQITASADRSASVQADGSVANVHLDDHIVTVLQDRVLLDGKQLSTLQANAAKVKISLSGGRLTISADGTQIASTQLGNK